MSHVESPSGDEGRNIPSANVSDRVALKSQELRNAIQAGTRSGPGADADSVFDRLERKCQAAAKLNTVG